MKPTPELYRRPAAGVCRNAIWVAVLAVAAALAGCGGGRPPNVLLLTFDTTRADFIGCYGRETAQTPVLDGLAAEGVLFEQARTSNPVTQAAHSTILTGVYPMLHGVRDNLLFHLPDEADTLAELLHARGFATGAAVGGFPLTREFGTAQGFDFYDDDLAADRRDFLGRPQQRSRRTWYDERPAGHVNDAIRPWLRQRNGKPFFVWLHYWDPHEPHIAPAPYGQLFAHDPYEGEIAYADKSLGALLGELAAIGELERTIVVMTADHGEGRREHHEMTHAFLAYDTTVHVPLIVRAPGLGGGRRVAERVGTVDIVPTILDLVGAPIPATLQGRSLVPLMRGESSRERRDYYSESLSPRLSHGFGELRVLYRDRYKLIHGPRTELFDLDADPRELHDLSVERPEELAALVGQLAGFASDHAGELAASAAHEADPETRRQLEALGYLSTTGERQEVTEELRTDGAPPQDRVGDINLTSRLRNELGAGRFHVALESVQRLLEGAPQNPFYRGKLAAAYLGLGRLEEAVAAVDGSEVVSSANAHDFLAVAQALADGGDAGRAVALATRIAETEGSAASWVAVAHLAQREEALEEELDTAIERALTIDHAHPEARLLRAARHRAQGDIEEAAAELAELMSEYPVYVSAQLEMARIERLTERSEEALSRLERALRLAPGFCEGYLEQLDLLLSLDRRAEAGAARRELDHRCRDEDTRRQAAQLLEEE